MSAAWKLTRPSYEKISLIVGIASVVLSGGYWYYEWRVRKERQSRWAARLERSPSNVPRIAPSSSPIARPKEIPQAQSTPVPPPTVALVKQVQHWINQMSGKKLGEPGHLLETGSADNFTVAAIKEFQKKNGMAETGKIDGMTQSLMSQTAAHKMGTALLPPGTFSFRVFWQPTPSADASASSIDGMLQTGHWSIEDSLRFINEVPGFGDRNKPPTEDVILEVLSGHYGPDSVIGRALKDKRYTWSCPDCATPPVAAPVVSGWGDDEEDMWWAGSTDIVGLSPPDRIYFDVAESTFYGLVEELTRHQSIRCDGLHPAKCSGWGGEFTIVHDSDDQIRVYIWNGDRTAIKAKLDAAISPLPRTSVQGEGNPPPPPEVYAPMYGGEPYFAHYYTPPGAYPMDLMQRIAQQESGLFT